MAINLNRAQTFTTLWQLDTPWFEPPNTARGGWSGVVKTELDVEDQTTSVFIKRQENHLTRTWQHWLSGIPTFQKEHTNILLLQALAIPTLEPVYFSRQGKKAILVTKALDDYISLDKLCRNDLSIQQRRSLLETAARVISTLHLHRLQHNCLYPKHIFVSPSSTGWDIRLIDLEKLRRCLQRKTAQVRDLSSLSRHADKAWSLSDYMRFFKAYVNEQQLSPTSKALWKQVAKKSGKKRR
jgi:hypothetical protein